MKKLLFVVTVLLLTAPGFGEVLVYKVSEKLKGYECLRGTSGFHKTITGAPYPNDPNAAGPLSGSSESMNRLQVKYPQFSGYLIMDVNVNSLHINDANTARDTAVIMALLLVDKANRHYTLIGTVADVNGNHDPNFGQISGTLHERSFFGKNGRMKAPVAAFECNVHIATYVKHDSHSSPPLTVNYYTYADFSWGFNAMVGPLSAVDIAGNGNKYNLPKSLNGHAYYNHLAVDSYNSVEELNAVVEVARYSNEFNEHEAYRTTTIKLDIMLTRNANVKDFSVKDTANDLVEQFKEQGYSEYLPGDMIGPQILW
jgi:hypothetical protein